ncbi:MAG: hypothetical protein WAM97_03325 [Acidimicrobiales bacterium]
MANAGAVPAWSLIDVSLLASSYAAVSFTAVVVGNVSAVRLELAS